MFGLGVPELIVILIVCLLLFGANRLPEIGRALGESLREFKKAMKGLSEEEEKSSSDKDNPNLAG